MALPATCSCTSKGAVSVCDWGPPTAPRQKRLALIVHGVPDLHGSQQAGLTHNCASPPHPGPEGGFPSVDPSYVSNRQNAKGTTLANSSPAWTIEHPLLLVHGYS